MNLKGSLTMKLFNPNKYQLYILGDMNIDFFKCLPYHKFKEEWKSYLLTNQIWPCLHVLSLILSEILFPLFTAADYLWGKISQDIRSKTSLRAFVGSVRNLDVSSLLDVACNGWACTWCSYSRGLRPGSKVCSEYMNDWQYLSLGDLEQNEFFLKSNLEVF